MDESEPRYLKPQGVTLIELLVALTLVTAAISLGSGFIHSGFSSAYHQAMTEEWLNYSDKCSRAIHLLANDSPLLAPGIYSDPFPDIQKPQNLSGTRLETNTTNFGNLKSLTITLTSKQGKFYQWSVFRYDN